MTQAPITAIVYNAGSRIDRVMDGVARHLERQGRRLAGLVQVNEPRSGDTRCDMTLCELGSGERLTISERRGKHARGCMLDVGALLHGVGLVSKALDRQPDMLIVNKFGKIEASGGGFRTVMAEAIDRGVPILVAVPVANLDAWYAFASGFAVTCRLEELPTDVGSLCLQLGLGNPKSAGFEGGGTSSHPSDPKERATPDGKQQLAVITS